MVARALASAFVRIKPDFTTFRKETETGVDAGTKGVGEKAGKTQGDSFGKSFLQAAKPALSGVFAAGAGLAGGSGLLALAGPIGAAGIAVSAFGALAVPILKKVETAHQALTAAQLAYTKASTAPARAAALKAEQAATAGLTKQQIGLMGTVDGVQKSFGTLENQMTPVVVTVASLAVKLASTLMPVLSKLVPVGAGILESFLKPLTRMLNSPIGVQFFAAVAKFGGQLGTLAGPQLVRLLGVFFQLFTQIMPSGIKILKQLLPAFVQMVGELLPIAVVAAKVLAVMVKWLASQKLLIPALWLLVAAFVALKLSLLSNPIFLIGAAIAVLAILVVKYHTQIWAFITRIWGDIFGFLKNTWNSILNFAKAWWPLLLGPAGLIIKYHRQVFGWIQNIWGSIVGFFTGLPGKLIGALSGLGQDLQNFASNAMNMFLNGVKSVWHDVVGWFSGLPTAILHALGIHSPPDWAIDAGKHVMGGLLKGISHGATDVKGYFTGLAGNLLGPLKGIWSDIFGGGGGGVGADVGRWTNDVMKALSMLGEPLTLTHQVLYQMQTESGGNPNAINLTDINAKMGDPSRGLMQVIGATFRAFGSRLLSQNIYDPLANIYAAINYAMHVYGKGLMSGGSGLGSGHGYGAGGLITEPIVGMGRSGQRYTFGEKGDETVIPGDVGGALGALGSKLDALIALTGRVVGHLAVAPGATGAATAGALNGSVRVAAHKGYYAVR